MDVLNGNVITRDIMNVCTSEEKAFLKNWLAESPANKQTYSYIKAMLQGRLVF